jgi:hypothetical protein
MDPTDPGLYHLVLDSTVLGVDSSVEVITLAARRFLEGRPD